MLTIVIPVRTTQPLTEFVEANEPYFKKHSVIVVNSGGGEELRRYSQIYVKKRTPFWLARKLAYSLVKTPLVLNLDSDVVIPEGYVKKSLQTLRKYKRIGAVSIFFKDANSGVLPHWGVLEYGISVWRTELLKKLYDYSRKKDDAYCECLYMWRKLEQAGYRLETLPYRAKHLK